MAEHCTPRTDKERRADLQFQRFQMLGQRGERNAQLGSGLLQFGRTSCDDEFPQIFKLHGLIISSAVECFSKKRVSLRPEGERFSFL